MVDLNFFSEKIEIKKSSRNKVLIVVIISALVVLLIGSGVGFAQFRAQMFRKEIKSMTTYLESDTVVQKKAELQHKKMKLEIMNKYNNAVESIASNIDNSDKIKSQFIELINTIIPKNIIVDNVSYTTQSVTIKGKSQKRSEIAELSHNLKGLEQFENVHVTSIQDQIQDQEVYIFDIKCVLKEVTMP